MNKAAYLILSFSCALTLLLAWVVYGQYKIDKTIEELAARQILIITQIEDKQKFQFIIEALHTLFNIDIDTYNENIKAMEVEKYYTDRIYRIGKSNYQELLENLSIKEKNLKEGHKYKLIDCHILRNKNIPLIHDSVTYGHPSSLTYTTIINCALAHYGTTKKSAENNTPIQFKILISNPVTGGYRPNDYYISKIKIINPHLDPNKNPAKWKESLQKWDH